MRRTIGLEGVTLLCFRQMAAWDEAIEAHPEGVCIVARKTKWDAVPLARAAHLAVQRGKGCARAGSRSAEANIGRRVPCL